MYEFQWDKHKGNIYQRVYQKEEEGKAQFDPVGELEDTCIVDSAQNSPEFCDAALVSDKFVHGNQQNLLALQDKLRIKLDHFLKNIFTDEMNHNHLEKTWQRERNLVSWFVNTV